MERGTVQVREIKISYAGRRKKLPSQLKGPFEVASFVRGIIGGDLREHMVALYLDGRQSPISYRVVSVGTATASLVHPREIFQGAIACGAVSLILCHNHPSGNSTPSAEDKEVTRRIANGGQILGIRLIDHVIVTGESFWSFKENDEERLCVPTTGWSTAPSYEKARAPTTNSTRREAWPN